ncbi:MAG: hypothetical protein Q8M22_16190 [Actinomycetota bacterium]|nr:hypothetical protein [Actinomycetota bacterium]
MVTECRVGGTAQRRVLPPSSLVELEVRIAVPKRGQIAVEGGILEPVTPGPTALLDVTARSSVWAVQPPPQQVSLPTSDRSLPSTSAFFEFTTGVVGQLVEIEIIVSFQNRPLQAATLTAAVRAKPGFREKLRVVPHPLSSPPEPTADTTPAAVMVDARTTSPFATGALSGPSVTEVARMLGAISLSASQVLGADDAPTSLTDQRALDLLIQMATKGSELMLLVAPLGYGEAGAIDQLVGPTDPVTPLELVYAGPAPHPDAQVCAVHRAAPPPVGEPCTLASVKRVCPYAFWGMYRRINRTVTLDRKTPPPSSAPLLIDDVLYGAANQADFGSTPGDRPSERLATAAQTLLGSRQAAPVTSWRAWRKEVGRRHPPLLVALAHTELENGTTSLLLGRRSYLRRADVSMKVVRPNGTPAPLVVLMACDSASADDPFGNLPGTFTARGAGAVIATLTKLIGRDGAAASREILRAIADATTQQRSVGDAVLAARRELIAHDVLLGLFLVNHGNLDMKVVA